MLGFWLIDLLCCVGLTWVGLFSCNFGLLYSWVGVTHDFVVFEWLGFRACLVFGGLLILGGLFGVVCA